MNNGLFQPMLDPNGTTNGIPNAAINAARQRANAAQGQPPSNPSQEQMSPEEMRARTNSLQSYGGPSSPAMAPGGDMQTMDPNAMSQQGSMPALNGPPDGANQVDIPTYVGNPLIDKYIHTFIGGA